MILAFQMEISGSCVFSAKQGAVEGAAELSTMITRMLAGTSSLLTLVLRKAHAIVSAVISEKQATSNQLMDLSTKVRWYLWLFLTGIGIKNSRCTTVKQ